MKAGKKPRDVRLDAVRGVLLVLMAAVHVPTPVSHFLQEPFGFMSEAEGFIFLSACLAGFAYGRTYCQTDWQAMSRRVWNRTGKIYFIHLAMVLPVVLIAWIFATRMTPLANHFHDFLLHPWGSLALIPLLLHQPPLFDILPLYVILLGLTPWLLAITRRRGWEIVLMFSALGWLMVQLNLGAHLTADPGRWLPVRLGAFNLLAWQLVWVSGLAFGETALRRSLLIGKRRAIVGAVSAPIVLAGLLARHGFFPFNPDWFLWMDKWTLGPLRLLNFAAWVGLLLAWNPRVPSRPLAPLALLGRHSLAVFSIHLPLVVAASTFVQSVPLSTAQQIAVGLSVIAVLFPWAAWLEYKPQPGQAPARTFAPSHRLPIRTRIRPVESFPGVPFRPLFSRVRATARTVHA
jgi:hypothetical protein